MQLTFRYRVKDKHVARLMEQAAAVNFVWNFCNEVQTKAVKDGREWLDDHDLDRLTKGATKEGLDLHSQTVQKICDSTTPLAGSIASLGWLGAKREELADLSDGFRSMVRH